MGSRWSSSTGRRSGLALVAASALLPFGVLSLTDEAPAQATGTTWYAYVAGGAPGPTPASCPQTSVPAAQCTLTEALALAGAGDIVALATPGATGHYVGNWTVGPPATSPGAPITIEPAAGVADPVLDGNLGNASGCTTASCAGPVLTVGTIARTGVTYVENVVHVVITGLAPHGLTIEDGFNTTPTQHGVGTGDGSGIFTLGGGIDNDWGGVLTVADTDFDDNTANFGGAIINASGDAIGSGAVTVIDCSFSGNRAVTGDGGAINTSGGGDNAAGSLTVTGSTFSANSASGTTVAKGDGGAIDNADEYGSNGAFTISGSTFIDNTASVDGGAIDNADNGGVGGTSAAPSSVATSTFMDNSADARGVNHGDGGAIDNADQGGSSYLTVTGSTFAANTAIARGAHGYPHYSANGGGIDNADHGGKGEIALSSSTFEGNATNSNRGGNSNGGAIDNADDGGTGTLTVSASTFVANAAEMGPYGSHGGAIDNADDGGIGTLAVSASTLDVNLVFGPGRDDGPLIETHDFGGTGTVAVSADIFNGTCAHGSGTGHWTDDGYNVGFHRTCESGKVHDVTYGHDLSGFLRPLADNGGPTPTIGLVVGGSPLNLAIGIIPNPTASLCPATDQRGYRSRAGAACDAGAFQTKGRPAPGT